MKAKLLLTFLMSFLLAISLAQALSINSNAQSNTITLTETQNSVTVNVTATNLSNFSVSAVSGVTITPLTAVNNVSSALYRFSASSSIPLGTTTSSSTITAVNAANSTDSASLILIVQRTNSSNGLCSGNNPGDLSLSIEDIRTVAGFGDDEDFWYPLDEVEIEISIENNGDEDIKNIETQVIIYDKETGETVLDEDDMDIDNDDFDLDSGDEETVTITFTMLADKLEAGNENYGIIIASTGEIDSNNDLDGDSTCSSDDESIEIKTSEPFVVLTDISLPTSSTCGEEAEISGEAWNIGDSDEEDVYIELYNRELGLDQRIELGDVDSFDNQDFRYSFLVPKNVTDKTYVLKLSVFNEDDDLFENDDDDTSEFSYQLKVEGCRQETKSASISAELSSDTPRAIAGKQIVIETTIKNTGNIASTYSIEILGNTQWSEVADVDPSTLTLSPGESKTASIYLDIDSDAKAEEKEFTIKATSGTSSTEQKVTLTIEKGFSASSIVDYFKNNWIVLVIILVNIVLIIAIIIVILSIVRRSK